MPDGRCYCGATKLTINGAANASTYCHCSDCKRWTGSAAPVFVAFPSRDVTLTPDISETSFAKGVYRRNCPDCGSPLTARFDYLPDQTYIPVGVLDDPDQFPPTLHCHALQKVAWIDIENDGLEISQASGRSVLNRSASK
jgi:hypothetical protein